MHKKVITLFGPKNVLHHWSSITSLTFAENHSDISVITLTVVITLLVATILTPVPLPPKKILSYIVSAGRQFQSSIVISLGCLVRET